MEGQGTQTAQNYNKGYLESSFLSGKFVCTIRFHGVPSLITGIVQSGLPLF